MHSLGGAVNRLERTLLNFFSWERVRGGFFGALEGRFAGVFGGEGGVRVGGFAAEFRGFWPGRGCGEAIQRTADVGGCSGRKIFKNVRKT